LLSDNFRVITPSHPGFGASSLPEHYTDVSDLGYFYLDFIAQLQLEDVLVVGVSFGAWVAADLAIKSTSRIRGLVLAGPLGAKFSDPLTREIKDLFSMPRFDMDQWLVSDPAMQRVDRSNWSAETLTRLARNHEAFALFAWSPTLYDPKLKHRLHRIDAPTKFIWGDQDRVVSLDYARQMCERVPGASLDVAPGAGHYVHRDNPERFAKAIIDFAASLRQHA
jgi:pimeloyl-ACP methyl ester carboxylesterase